MSGLPKFTKDDVNRFNKFADKDSTLRDIWVDAANASLRFGLSRGEAVKAANKEIARLRRKYFTNPGREDAMELCKTCKGPLGQICPCAGYRATCDNCKYCGLPLAEFGAVYMISPKRAAFHCSECGEVYKDFNVINDPFEKNPWTEKDVIHKNKKAAANAGARKLWVRVANATLERTGDDRMAVIAANIAVKNYFKKHKKNPGGLGPAKGDGCLMCIHLAKAGKIFGNSHWFGIPGGTKFGRPDGSMGEAKWIVICDDCFKKHGSGTKAPLGGDFVWDSDLPPDLLPGSGLGAN